MGVLWIGEPKLADKKLDPRVMKTRLNLRHALGYLMRQEDLKDISVQKITDTAHITRGTFYLHYIKINKILSVE